LVAFREQHLQRFTNVFLLAGFPSQRLAKFAKGFGFRSCVIDNRKLRTDGSRLIARKPMVTIHYCIEAHPKIISISSMLTDHEPHTFLAGFRRDRKDNLKAEQKG